MPGEVSQTPVGAEVNSRPSLAEKVSQQRETLRSKLKATKIGQQVSFWWQRVKGKFASPNTTPGGATQAFLAELDTASTEFAESVPSDRNVPQEEGGPSSRSAADSLELVDDGAVGVKIIGAEPRQGDQPSEREMSNENKISQILEAENGNGNGPLTQLVERMTKTFERSLYTQFIKRLPIADMPKDPLEWEALGKKKSVEELGYFLGDMSTINTGKDIVGAIVNKVQVLKQKVNEGQDITQLYKQNGESFWTLRGIQLALKDFSRISRKNSDKEMASIQQQASRDLLDFRRKAGLTLPRQLLKAAPVAAAMAIEHILG